MKKQVAITAMLMCLVATANAQSFLDHLQDKQTKGSVTVTQSKEIDDLVNGKQIAIPTTPATTTTPATPKTPTTPKPSTSGNTTPKTTATTPSTTIDTATIDTRKKVMRNSRKVTGYRVQAYAGGNTRADRTKAQRVGNDIKSHFPNMPIYVHFYSPRWICRVGNFRTYEDAAEMLKEVKKLGYKSAVIVKGKVTVQQ